MGRWEFFEQQGRSRHGRNPGFAEITRLGTSFTTDYATGLLIQGGFLALFLAGTLILLRR
jgi:hypothetical protein